LVCVGGTTTGAFVVFDTGCGSDGPFVGGDTDESGARDAINGVRVLLIGLFGDKPVSNTPEGFVGEDSIFKVGVEPKVDILLEPAALTGGFNVGVTDGENAAVGLCVIVGTGFGAKLAGLPCAA